MGVCLFSSNDHEFSGESAVLQLQSGEEDPRLPGRDVNDVPIRAR